MAGCKRRSRLKQMSKWERECTFRAGSVVKEEFVCLSVCMGHTLCTSHLAPCGSICDT